MDMGFPAERAQFFHVPIKLAQPVPAPELRTKILWTRGFFGLKVELGLFGLQVLTSITIIELLGLPSPNPHAY